MVRLTVAMLRRGLRIGSQHLLTAPRRWVGQLRGAPVSIATVEGARYVVAAFADASRRRFGSRTPDQTVA